MNALWAFVRSLVSSSSSSPGTIEQEFVEKTCCNCGRAYLIEAEQADCDFDVCVLCFANAGMQVSR